MRVHHFIIQYISSVGSVYECDMYRVITVPVHILASDGTRASADVVLTEYFFHPIFSSCSVILHHRSHFTLHTCQKLLLKYYMHLSNSVISKPSYAMVAESTYQSTILLNIIKSQQLYDKQSHNIAIIRYICDCTKSMSKVHFNLSSPRIFNSST